MTDLYSLVGIAVSAFVATNIDDIFVLMLFFSDRRFRTSQVVIGQYFGIGMLVAISALGSLLALVVPHYVIGLLGLVPIGIGVIRLVHLLKDDTNSTPVHTTERASRWPRLSMLTVAAVTFSNGGDNIGIYTPLFAKYNLAYEVIFISVIFMIMTAIWCAIASYLVNHPFIATRIRKTGHIIFPFVLIALGIYILTDTFFI